MLMMLAACGAAPIEPPLANELSIGRGEVAARRLGCGACHDIPGSDWPKGRVGPPLAGFGDRAIVVGRFSNHLTLHADFDREPPSPVPETGSLAVTVNERVESDLGALVQNRRD